MLAVVFLTACKKETTDDNVKKEPQAGNLTISVRNMAGAEDLVFSDMRYTNAAGNMYSITMLKYYISNIRLHKKDGSSKSLNVYKLIDAKVSSSCIIDAGTIDAGEYDSLSFYVGIDPTRNHTGAQDGDLDVSKGMFWTWNTGYIFYKHEGQYKNSANQTKALVLHLGTDNAYSKVSLPVTLNVDGNRKMEIKMDLNSVYASPVNIDFNTDNSRQSTSAGDATWIAKMKSNFADAFSFIKAE